jgi:hypothetical protein
MENTVYYGQGYHINCFTSYDGSEVFYEIYLNDGRSFTEYDLPSAISTAEREMEEEW